MLKKEFYKTREDGIKLYMTYSTDNYKIKQLETGEIYDNAIDIENQKYTYEETNEKTEEKEEVG